jgi:hypothetical protein
VGSFPSTTPNDVKIGLQFIPQEVCGLEQIRRHNSPLGILDVGDNDRLFEWLRGIERSHHKNEKSKWQVSQCLNATGK